MSALFSRKSRIDNHPIGASAYHNDPVLSVDRQAKRIQQSLQILIDAQSEGLLASLAGPNQDGSASRALDLGSSQGPPAVSARQPTKKRIGLRAAREGISNSMDDLLRLRRQQHGIIGTQVDGRKDALLEIDTFNSKRTGLENTISAIQEGDSETQRSRELREESRNLETDIKELETKLQEMKSRQRHVLSELSQTENAVDAKLSSYKSSLSLVESNIQKFLKNPPLGPLASTAEGTTFYSLIPKRRTLGLAQEHWQSEQAELGSKEREVEAEISALEEGGDTWKQVVAKISSYEKRLKAELRRSVQTQSQLVQPGDSVASNSNDEQSKSILEGLEETINFVASKLELAEDREWRLLVCCIGAELEALNEARNLLSNVFSAPEGDPSATDKETANNTESRGEGEDSQTNSHDVDNPEPPPDLLRDADEHSHDPVDRSEEDDEPDPAWLLPET